ncbi:50S ribosomal protein L29 [Falsiporphyromonas endometrii]|uniref:Large ribosomal subunit protein uL29 n=1 Tax=Falsiporphyromonas endometrii TaxID=1387297 RepID=A0ABV9K5D2_9PORP
MKIAEIKELTTGELQERLVALMAEYDQKRIDHSVSSLENPSELKNLRRTIARINTILAQRSINND